MTLYSNKYVLIASLCRWHPQLADKGPGVKTHTYWAMLNSGGNADTLKESFGNIVEHYRNRHAGCHHTSRCKQPRYVPSRQTLTAPSAINLLKETIHSLYMYKHPEKYTLCMNTHYVESFNNLVLVYLD